MTKLAWDSQAQEALQRVPMLVRPLARRKVEERVAAAGRRRVTLSDFAEAEARFRSALAGKSEAELKALLPTDNEPGVEMVVLEACRAGLSNCPNPLIDVESWRQALEQWVRESDISERLRARVEGRQVLYHHKLRLVLAGCPNGCSRPQIADLALVGMARPVFAPEACTACGACQEACPDQALSVDHAPPRWDQQACQGCLACCQACPSEGITLAQPGVRILMGGKLGRHPHLARPVGEALAPGQALDLLAAAVDNYLTQARPGERFAAWHQRTRT